jgi:hypothetical protein
VRIRTPSRQWRADTPFTVTDGTFEADLVEGPYN